MGINANPFRKINVFGKVKEEGCHYFSFIFFHCISQWCLFVKIIFKINKYLWEISNPLTHCLIEWVNCSNKYQGEISNPLTFCLLNELIVQTNINEILKSSYKLFDCMSSNKYQLKISNLLTACLIESFDSSNKYQGKIKSSYCLFDWMSYKVSINIKGKSNPLTYCLIEWVNCPNKYNGEISNLLTVCVIEWVDYSNKYQRKSQILLHPVWFK